MGRLFEGRSTNEQRAILAALERAGAAVYRSIAAQEPDSAVRDGLLAAAAREVENADFLDQHGGA
jgi:hypothetical protein